MKKDFLSLKMMKSQILNLLNNQVPILNHKNQLSIYQHFSSINKYLSIIKHITHQHSRNTQIKIEVRTVLEEYRLIKIIKN